MNLGGCNLISRVASLEEGKERDPANEVGVAESRSHVGVSEEGFSCEHLQELGDIC